MKGQRLPVCTNCRLQTPRFGETVCGRCQEARENADQWEHLIAKIRGWRDATDEDRFEAIAEALEMLKRGEA